MRILKDDIIEVKSYAGVFDFLCVAPSDVDFPNEEEESIYLVVIKLNVTHMVFKDGAVLLANKDETTLWPIYFFKGIFYVEKDMSLAHAVKVTNLTEEQEQKNLDFVRGL